MDQLSQAVSSLRVGRGTVRRFRQSGSWGLGYFGLPGSGFHVVLHGTGWLLTPSAAPVQLKQGDVVLITAGADHGLSSDPRPMRGLLPVGPGIEQSLADRADFEFLCGAYRLQHGNVHPYLAALPDPIVLNAASRAVIDLLDEYESAPKPGADAARHALLDLMLLDALNRWLDSAEQPPTSDPAISSILLTLNDNPRNGWSVQALSHLAGMSRATFTRRFTAAVGTTPRAYLLAKRLNLAARLLIETDVPLVSIAGQTGYATEFALASAFRHQYGIAPGRFRRSRRG